MSQARNDALRALYAQQRALYKEKQTAENELALARLHWKVDALECQRKVEIGAQAAALLDLYLQNGAAYGQMPDGTVVEVRPARVQNDVTTMWNLISECERVAALCTGWMP